MKTSILFLTLFILACSSEADENESPTMDVPSAIECDQNAFDFETDFRGPGWNSEKGAPIETLENYFITTTVAILRKGPETEKEFQDLNREMGLQLDSWDGHIATKFAGSSQCRTARTLSIWKSQASINSFVSSPTHILAIGRAIIFNRGGATTRWESTTLPTWEEVHKKIALKTPLIY